MSTTAHPHVSMSLPPDARHGNLHINKHGPTKTILTAMPPPENGSYRVAPPSDRGKIRDLDQEYSFEPNLSTLNEPNSTDCDLLHCGSQFDPNGRVADIDELMNLLSAACVGAHPVERFRLVMRLVVALGLDIEPYLDLDRVTSYGHGRAPPF